MSRRQTRKQPMENDTMMKRILRTTPVLMLLASMLVPLSARAEDGLWLTDFEQAKKIAAKKKLPILMDFSGSDWCIWCKRLNAEVLQKEEFKKYAKDNLVLFLADFPMRKKQGQAEKAQNRKLQQVYGVRGFPTVLLVDATGKELARTGYQKGGPELYVAHLKKLLEQAPKAE